MPQVQNDRARPASRPFESYLREINETALLGAAEEQDLAWRIEEGDAEARDHLVRANLRLVVNISRAYAGRGLALEDLIAEGNLGLMRAAEGFDPSLGVRFSTYACYWVKQSIKRALLNTGKTVRVPAYMAELLTKWKRAAANLQEELGRTPTQEEVAQCLNLSAKKLKIVQKAFRVYNGAVQEETDGDRLSLADLVGVDNSPDARPAWAEELGQVLCLLDKLEKRESAVLRLRLA